MKKLCLIVALCLILSACSPTLQHESLRRSDTFLDLFDTVTTLVSCSHSQEEFSALCDSAYTALLRYHRLFDIYHEYEGMANLKTVNDNAGVAPVQVDAELIAFLKDCRAYYDLTDGNVNVAMGAVLQWWHAARENALRDPQAADLPDMADLFTAAAHCDISALEIDEEASTVYLRDAQMRLDVGAVAKGWACQRVAESLPEGILLSIGGNVCATGPKQMPNTSWVIGVQDPDGGDAYLQKIEILRGSVVTSGDYIRRFEVNGKYYHHIIDPQTLLPSDLWRSVTVICDDSGLADALSTALFLVPYTQGEEMLKKVGAHAMWVAPDGQQYFSDGFPSYLVG